jgi:O-antigen/teichoic acid export membrane protein
VAIVAVGQLFNVFFGSVGYFLSMSGYERETLKGQILAVVINVIMCLSLVPFWGAIGSAIGVAVGLISWNALLFYMVKRRIGIKSSAF